MRLRLARLSSSNFLLFILFVIAGSVAAQTPAFRNNQKDYKDRKSHERFGRRRFTVSAWQINQLKQGALVVKLNTSQLLIEAFNARDLPEEAERARLEQAAANINIIRSYVSKYKFSKVYFIYSHSSDSLLKGTRSGIFLDYDLRIDPTVTMKESFYLIAETDYVYNSSIGFVPEDSAATTIERGNPSPSEFPIVLKNKYGHQLKNPFPFSISKAVMPRGTQVVDLSIEGKSVPFTVRSSKNRGGTPASTYRINGKHMELILLRLFSYNVMSQAVDELNIRLNSFYRNNEHLSEDSKDYRESKPFFY